MLNLESPIPGVPIPMVLNEIESCDVTYSLVNSLSVNILRSNPESDVSDVSNVNCWFFITLIWGFTSAIDWFDPPVFAVNGTILSGFVVTSINAS